MYEGPRRAATIDPEKPETEMQHESLDFERAARLVIEEGRRRTGENAAKNGFSYHTVENHLDPLEARYDIVARALGLSTRKVLRGKIMVARHDQVIAINPWDPENIVAMRTRKRGARSTGEQAGSLGPEGNEGVSAVRAKEAMQESNREAGREIFSDEDIGSVVSGIEATYTEAEFAKKFEDGKYYDAIVAQNPKVGEIISELEAQGISAGLLFSQTHLENPLEQGEAVPPEVLAMALCDLGGPGMGTPEEFAFEGDMEFQELHPNIATNLSRLTSGREPKDQADRELVATKMLEWLGVQVGFATWQMLRLEKILHLQEKMDVAPDTAAKIRSVFNRFEENIHACLARTKGAKQKYAELRGEQGELAGFTYLANLLHYA